MFGLLSIEEDMVKVFSDEEITTPSPADIDFKEIDPDSLLDIIVLPVSDLISNPTIISV
jgi:hypothetical protein